MRFSGRIHLFACLVVVAACACANPLGSDVPPLGSLPAGAVAAQAPGPSPSASHGPAVPALELQQVKGLLIASARRHGVNPYLVMAVAWWESGWNQNEVSSTGAVGIMQVEPYTAASAGPRLLHRAADLHNPADNVELGTAVLRENLDNFNDNIAAALVAYYAGPGAVTDWKDQDPDSKRYVLGVYSLAIAFSNGTGPA
jgi:soluble lytic murein transglycosylase-like protein